MALLDSGLRSAAVVGEGDRLIGMITEGDVVRVVARGSGPGLTAEDIMNVNPDFLVDPEPDAELIDLFLEMGHLAVPILDDQGRFLRLASTSAALKRALLRP